MNELDAQTQPQRPSEHDGEEELPFALVDNDDRTLPLRNEENVISPEPPASVLTLLERSSFFSSSTATTAPPGLASSVISSPTDGESQASSYYYNNDNHHNHEAASTSASARSSSLLHPSSQYLDAAASLLHPSSSLLHSLPLCNSHVSSLSATTASATATTETILLTPSESLSTSLSPYLSSSATNDAAHQPPRNMYNSPDRIHSSSSITIVEGDGFSVLLQAADDRQQQLRPRLPALPEEDLHQSQASRSTTTGTSQRHQQRSPPQHQQQTSQQPQLLQQYQQQSSQPQPPQEEQQMSVSQTIVPAATPTSTATGALAAATAPFLSLFRSDERRLASLAGATATRTGEDSFRVSLDLSASNTRSVQDVMAVVGNAEFLRLWCDAIPNLIITKSSEGVAAAVVAAQSAAAVASEPASATSSEHQLQRRRDHEYYEGEWIDATTPPLLPPPHTSCFYSTSRKLSEALGFPSYGKVVVFVERQRGQVSLTMSPFPGNVEVVYQIRVEQQHPPQAACVVGGGRIRIVNEVRLQRDHPSSAVMTTTTTPTRSTTGSATATTVTSSESCGVGPMCGMWNLVEKCLLPTVDDYMDQVLSSTARLRFLVENQQHNNNGETFCSSFSMMMHNNSIIREESSFQGDSMRTPLLS